MASERRASDAAICPDCGRPVETHAMFDPPRCPVIRLAVQWLCVYDGSTAPIEVVQPACPECGREMQRALKEQAVSAAYLLFRGEFYYPGGGWDDYVGTFSTLDEAKAAVTPTEFQWAHVVDLSTGEIVARQEAKRPWEML